MDGADIIAAAREKGQKALAKLEAKEAAAKAKAKKEEERVAELKRIRGEKWLPSIAKEMQVTLDSCNSLSSLIVSIREFDFNLLIICWLLLLSVS